MIEFPKTTKTTEIVLDCGALCFRGRIQGDGDISTDLGLLSDKLKT